MAQTKMDKQQQEMIQKQAHAYFAKVANRSIWKRLQQSRNGESHLPALNALPANGNVTVIEVSVALDAIVGSVNPGRARDFDANFAPRTSHTRNRWLSVASQLLSGRSLPPVELIKTNQGYYVSDGHHRISVCKALGRDEINAIVVVC